MNDNAEGGIASTQAQAVHTNGLSKHHKSTVGYINDRIWTYASMFFFVVLCAVWLTSSSPAITYGALTLAILVVMFWGVQRIKQIRRTQTQRELQAEQWKSTR